MDINTFDFAAANPGSELRNYLMELIPNEALQISGDATNSFVDRVDYLFKHDGEYKDIIYFSTINSLLRRIIKSAQYFKKRGAAMDNYDYLDETRSYLNTTTRFAEDEIEKILGLLLVIVSYATKKPSSGTKNNFFKLAKETNEPCYICGKEINHDDVDSWEYIQMEHFWPKGMGGSNAPFNLKVACQKCNRHKQEFIDTPEYHYEHITYKTVLEENINHEEFKYVHKLAIWGKNDFKCALCNRNTAEVGPLKFKRINPNDTWHFFNMAAFCDDHYVI